MAENLEPNNKVNNQISDKNSTSDPNGMEKNSSQNFIDGNEINTNSQNDKAPKVGIKNENDPPVKTIPQIKKELPIEKKPFQEFINIHLIPALTEEIKERGLEIININLKNTNRPIAGDKCWVIYCEIKNTCIFWLSFEKEDISSVKSISLSKPNQKPSIIESFLIDEKRITLKLIISRVLQRLNGQKLIGIN